MATTAERTLDDFKTSEALETEPRGTSDLSDIIQALVNCDVSDGKHVTHTQSESSVKKVISVVDPASATGLVSETLETEEAEIKIKAAEAQEAEEAEEAEVKIKAAEAQEAEEPEEAEVKIKAAEAQEVEKDEAKIKAAEAMMKAAETMMKAAEAKIMAAEALETEAKIKAVKAMEREARIKAAEARRAEAEIRAAEAQEADRLRCHGMAISTGERCRWTCQDENELSDEEEYYCRLHDIRRRCQGLCVTRNNEQCYNVLPELETLRPGVPYFCYQHDPNNDLCNGWARTKGRPCRNRREPWERDGRYPYYCSWHR